jgi:hypothetical protein
MNFVRYGRKSPRKLDYTLGADGTATAAFAERPDAVGSAYTRA